MPPVNYLAIVVAGLAAFVIGALWYTALFGKQWLAAQNFTPEQMAAAQKDMAKTYGISVVCYIVMAFVLSVLIGNLDIVSAGTGAKLGALCWLGFAATIGLTASLYGGKSIKIYYIDAAYQLVFMTVMGAILGAWR
ncbi:MAG: DUF1761 domain-containing protein [Gemmatimonadales bacterium]|nr:DUF1761 domain-containing protein [Gemmatimonadales bacterium]